MEDSINITEVLESKNQEILHAKKKNDLEKSMESLLLFFQNHSSNCAQDVKNRLFEYLNIKIDSDEAQISSNLINTFFEMSSSKLKEVIDEEIKKIELKLDLPHDEYSNELMIMASNIKNKMANYFSNNEDENNKVIDMLANALFDNIGELVKNIDEETKKKIYKYLSDVITIKLINVLNEKVDIYIGLIKNNYVENQKVMDRINEKTLQNEMFMDEIIEKAA